MKCMLFFLGVGMSLAVSAQDTLQFPVTNVPLVFGPGIVSDGFSNRDMAISPDGNDLYFTLQWSYGLFSVILHAQKTGGVWSKPDTAFFSGRFNDLEPAFSPDGERLYFTSNRPLNGKEKEPKDYDIWYLQKKGNRWDGPMNMGSVINSEKDEFFPSVANSGNLYFTRDNRDSKDDIFMSLFRDGKYELPKALPDEINSRGFDFNAFIDPEENYIIFSSYKRSDELGRGDLYFSKKAEGVWLPARHFDYPVNSGSLDYSPFVSPDHKYFFFTSKRTLLEFPFPKAKSAAEIKNILNACGNGNDDIYIMNFETVWKMMK